MEDLEMSAQERLFYGGVCPSLQQMGPKREREDGIPDLKKARVESTSHLSAGTMFVGLTNPAHQAKEKGAQKGKGKGSKGAKGQNSRGWGSYQGRDWNQSQWSTPWPSQSAELPDLVHRLSQIVVKHEYAINNLKQDSTVYLFIKPGAQGLLPILFNTSEKWNRVQREHPEQTEESLRIVLLKAFLLELGQRLRNYKESEEAQAAAKELGWLTEDGRWKAVAWNPTVGALEEVPKGHTWTTDAIVAETVELRKLVTQDNIYRFQSIKGLTKEPQTAWVQLALEVSMRDSGHRIWEIIQSWTGCSALHALGCCLRKERGGLSQQVRSIRW